MASLNRFHNTVYGTSSSNSYATTFERLNELKVIGTKTDLDGEVPPIFMFNIEQKAKQIKLNYAFFQVSFYW